MSNPTFSQSDSPIAEPHLERDGFPTPRRLNPGLRLNIRGRSIKLRGLHRPPTGIWRWLALLGPGMVAGAAGNDAGGIATYSQAGAQFGYSTIWVLVLVTISLAVIQETSARLGAATGRGLLDLIRERFGLRWSLLAVGALLVANAGLVVSEFIGVGAAFELVGVSKLIVVPLAAVLVWYLVVGGSYPRVERIFLAMTLVFLAYPVAALLAQPHWGEVARGAFIPTVSASPSWVLLFVALLGTTLTPYQQIFQQSAIVEKRVGRRHYGPERADAYAGAIFSNAMSIFMVIATAATLHVAGKTDIASAADAAQALKPVAGAAAEELFAVGLLGASLLAAAVLPLATAYSLSEAFGFAKGVNLPLRKAPAFFGIFTALVALGAAVALIPGLPVIPLLFAIQVLNGALLPIILVFLMRLANDRELTGELANSRAANILGWATVIVVTLAVAVLFGSQLLTSSGLSLPGAS